MAGQMSSCARSGSQSPLFLRHKLATHLAPRFCLFTMVMVQLQESAWKLNDKENRASKRPKLNVDAHCLTSGEGMELAKKQQDEQQAEAWSKTEVQAEREAKEAEWQQTGHQLGTMTVFTGLLNSKAKEDLKDIAFVLGLALKGNKDNLAASIKSHFNSHPGLSDNPWYQGLFGRTRASASTAPSAPSTSMSHPLTPVQPRLPLCPCCTNSSQFSSFISSPSHNPTYLPLFLQPSNSPIHPRMTPYWPPNTPYIYHNPSYYYPNNPS